MIAPRHCSEALITPDKVWDKVMSTAFTRTQINLVVKQLGTLLSPGKTLIPNQSFPRSMSCQKGSRMC